LGMSKNTVKTYLYKIEGGKFDIDELLKMDDPKIEHKAGHELFIDYAGKKLQIVDRETGEIKDVEVFVALLPHSQHTYVEATMT